MSEIGKTVKIAVYRDMGSSCLHEYEYIGKCKLYEHPGSTYVRISEAVEVNFEPLKNDAVIQDALRALDAAELKVREELQRTLDKISNQRSQLLALTHSPAVTEDGELDEPIY